MYLTPYQKKQLTIVIVLVIGIPLTLFGIYQAVRWFTGASGETKPKNVVMANVTSNSVTITWTTDIKQTGSVVPVLNGTERGTVIDKRGTGRRYTHYVELKNLEPGTNYDFKIISGGDTYTNTDNDEFSFRTQNITTDTPVPKPVHAQLAGSSQDDVIIYVTTKDKSTYPVATIPSTQGNWLVDLSVLRKVSDGRLYQVTDSTELVIIAVSRVDDAGILQGQYSNIFDSSGKLTETLVTTGNEYDNYINDAAKLIAQDTPEDTGDDDDITNPSDTGGEPIDEDDDNDKEIVMDLEWIDMVKAGETSPSSPSVYGQDTVQITNLTDTSFSVLWFSETQETGHIMYGTDSDNLTETGRDERDGVSSQEEYFLHSIEVINLQQETTYYFEVYSGNNKYSKTFETTTFSTLSSPPQFETISGNILADDYNNEDVAIIATFTDDDGVGSSGSSYPISTLVSSEGTWILTIGGARDEEGQYFDKNNDDIVTFNPMYLNQSETVKTTLSEATAEDIEIALQGGSQNFVKIPLLADYGILVK
jgi:hypothetical protein